MYIVCILYILYIITYFDIFHIKKPIGSIQNVIVTMKIFLYNVGENIFEKFERIIFVVHG